VERRFPCNLCVASGKHLYAAVLSPSFTPPPTAPAVFTKGKETLNGSHLATKFEKTDKINMGETNGARDEKNKAEVLAIKGIIDDKAEFSPNDVAVALKDSVAFGKKSVSRSARPSTRCSW